jgi:hypothetical protein
MVLKRVSLGFLLIATLLSTACVVENELPSSRFEISKGGDDRNGPYDVIPGWWKPAPDHNETWTWGQAAGVWPDTPDRILVTIWGDQRRNPQPGGQNERQRNFLVVVDRDGNIIENWSQWDSLFNRPHQIYINPYDPERAVWVDERGGNGVHEAILKFSNDGSELLLQMEDPNPVFGEGGPNPRENPNPGPLDFGQNSVLAFLPNGDFLLGDGYQNGRIVRYNAEGELLYEFGSVGDGPGQFDLIHGVAVDRDNRIYVSDRRNHRIQIFTEDGTLLDEWPDIWDPVAIMIDVNNYVWILDATLNRILKYNLNGQLLDYFGTYGEASSLGRPGFTCADDEAVAAAGLDPDHSGACGGFSLPHQMSVDSEGNLYVAQFGGPWIDKYVPRPDADPARLIGQPLGH